MILTKITLGIAFIMAVPSLPLMLKYFYSKGRQMARVSLKLLLIVCLPITIISLIMAMLYPSAETVAYLAYIVWGSLIGGFTMTELTVHIIGPVTTKLFTCIDQKMAN